MAQSDSPKSYCIVHVCALYFILAASYSPSTFPSTGLQSGFFFGRYAGFFPLN